MTGAYFSYGNFRFMIECQNVLYAAWKNTLKIQCTFSREKA